MATRPESRWTDNPVPVAVAQRMLEKAKEEYEVEGQIEIDLPDTDKEILASVSACDDYVNEGGMYVKAWVWVEL